MRLDHKVAIVTGGGQGIGRGIARVFAEVGARLAIAARSADKLEGVRAEIEAAGGEVLAVVTDVGQADDVRRLVTATLERFGRLDVLVNNAG
ncbi:MAG: SDR family NAD(P)-dependent oxidoreductase, partial [Gemmatimonadota bacterium]